MNNTGPKFSNAKDVDTHKPSMANTTTQLGVLQQTTQLIAAVVVHMRTVPILALAMEALLTRVLQTSLFFQRACRTEYIVILRSLEKHAPGGRANWRANHLAFQLFNAINITVNWNHYCVTGAFQIVPSTSQV